GLTAPAAGPTLALTPAAAPRGLPGGLDPWWVILGLAAVLAMAVALTGMPARVLDAAAAECETGEDLCPTR
nr:hypothetical protein [Actinomycetota bacterium]